MSKPDFDGVYRTRPAEGVFTKKQRPQTTPKSTTKTPKKTTAPRDHRGQPPTPTPKPPLKGVFGGCGESWGWSQPPSPPDPNLGVGTKTEPKKSTRRKEKKPAFVILEDTRENTPLRDWPEGASVREQGLDTGDYSIEGWERCFTIERKSIGDLAGTMIDGYEPNSQKPRLRFNNELERMRHFDLAAVIVTATPEQLLNFKHHCGMDAHAALWNFALAVFSTYGIPVFPLTDEKTAARWIYDLARHYINVRTKKNRSREDKANDLAAVWGF